MTRSELSKAEEEMSSRTSGTDSFGRTRRLKSVDLQIYPQVVLVDKMFLRVFFCEPCCHYSQTGGNTFLIDRIKKKTNKQRQNSMTLSLEFLKNKSFIVHFTNMV